MLLQELSRRSGVSTASIKFYRREGLLPPGERITATRSDYGPHHLDRLQLIQVMRELAHASVASVRVLCAALDDPERPLVAALEIAQALALGLDVDLLEPGIPEDEDPRVRDLLAELGWPDASSAPRLALGAMLREMEAQQIPLPPAALLRYARPMGRIAAEDLRDIRAGGGEDAPPPSADAIVLRAVVGSISYSRLLVVLRALGHASHSIIDADLSRTPDGSAPPRDA
ncbi:MerR family transcriptional regulator [Brachybacterium hainanense]|uniref:MerR family transcriptional regulator n=1 Tax=Brachybacterium hainanense TaxID=1541174 RepID=A0ABV6R666_9MICO